MHLTKRGSIQLMANLHQKGTKRGIYKIKPSEKAKMALTEHLVNGKSKADAIRAAGYKESVARKPKDVFRTRGVVTEKAKLLSKYNLTLDKAFSILSSAAEANKVSTDKKTGDFIITDVPDLAIRMKASDRIREIINEDIPQTNGTALAEDNPHLTDSIKKGDEITLQRIIFSKTLDESTTVKAQ